MVEHHPDVCGACQSPLGQAAAVLLYERRQVHELPPVMRLRVREHRALHVRCPRCEPVSGGRFPAEASSRAQYGPYLRALPQAGLRSEVRFHDLRHTAATVLLSRGVNVKVVSEMLGHADVSITLRVYARVLPHMQQAAVDVMQGVVAGKGAL